MSMLRLRDHLVRYWWVLLLCCIVASTALVVQAASAETTYTSTSRVRVTAPFDGDGVFRDFDRDLAERMTRTYIELSGSEPVLRRLRTDLMLDELPHIDVTVVPGTELVEIDVVADDPDVATTVADAMVEVFVDRRWDGDGSRRRRVCRRSLRRPYRPGRRSCDPARWCRA